MTSMKIDARSQIGELVAADLKSGAMAFDQSKGAFCKPSTQQEYLLTNKDRVVRWDGAVSTLNEYSKSLKNFCPIDALQDGEKLDRTRTLSKNDILAKPTWSQIASEGALTIAQGAVVGAALGTVGGAIYGIATHRRSLPSGSNVADNSANGSAGSNTGAQPGIGVARNALHAAPFGGPFNPGNLHPPPPVIINSPPAPAMTPGQAAQEQAAQGAFAAGGAIVGAFVGGPIGAAIGGVIGAGMGAAWNEAIR